MVGNLGVFKCDHMLFGLCNVPVTFQQLMHKCLSELNLIYCCIYLEVCAFPHLMDHYQQFIKGIACIAQMLNEHPMGEEASRKLEQVSLLEDALKAFDALKQMCMSAPILAFTDYTKEFLLEDQCVQGGTGGSNVPKGGG